MAAGKAKLSRSLVVDAAIFAAKECSASEVRHYIETGELSEAKDQVEPYDPDAVKAVFDKVLNGGT